MQLARVAGEAEEPVLLGYPLHRRAVVRALAIGQLVLRVELLAADAVQTFVSSAVQVAAGLAGPPQPLDAGPVPRVAAGANEVVEAERQVLAQPGESAGVAVDQLPGADSFGVAGEDVLQRVVVGAALQPDLVADTAMVPGEHVRLDELERVPDVGLGVDVRDRGAEIDALSGHRNLLNIRGTDPAHDSRPLKGLVRTEVLAALDGPG